MVPFRGVLGAAAALLLAATTAVAAEPFLGEPAIWSVKISDTCATTPKGPTNSSVLEGATGIYGCYTGDTPGEDYYAVCNDTHITSFIFEGSPAKNPCSGKLKSRSVTALGKCVNYDPVGQVKDAMYTYNCYGMWCNSTCNRPPCPLDFPCPQETWCCLNDNAFEVQCGTEAGCSGEEYEESWFWGFLRKLLLLGILVSGVMYLWQMGYCNVCPWRRPYSTLYGEMA